MIDRIVYSYWTAPSGDGKNITNWCNTRSALMSSVLSVMESKKNFKEVVLVTDKLGFDLLVSKLNLPFTETSLSLENIDNKYRDFWSLGKVVAYAEQQKPFVHLDFDGIIFKPLPDQLLNAGTFAQHKEIGCAFRNSYSTQIEYLKANDFKLPADFGKLENASCLGIIGFNNMDFLKLYCERALDLVYSNSEKWNALSSQDKWGYCVVFEQYMYDCIAKEMNVPISYLTNKTSEEDINPELTELGYTHIWGYKKNPTIEQMLEHKLSQLYPEYIPIIDNILNS